MFGIVICLALVGDVSAADQPSQVTRDDVEVLARQYRIQVYNLFRTQRDTFDTRTEVANEVLDIARRLRIDADSHVLLAEWFDQARNTAGDQALPAIPQLNENEFEKLGIGRSSIAKRSELTNEDLDDDRLNGLDLSDATGTQTQQTSVELDEVQAAQEGQQSGGLLKAIGNLFSTDQPNADRSGEATNSVQAEIDFDDAN